MRVLAHLVHALALDICVVADVDVPRAAESREAEAERGSPYPHLEHALLRDVVRRGGVERGGGCAGADAVGTRAGMLGVGPRGLRRHAKGRGCGRRRAHGGGTAMCVTAQPFDRGKTREKRREKILHGPKAARAV